MWLYITTTYFSELIFKYLLPPYYPVAGPTTTLLLKGLTANICTSPLRSILAYTAFVFWYNMPCS